MKQKSNLFKTLGIMLLFVLFATQANAQKHYSNRYSK